MKTVTQWFEGNPLIPGVWEVLIAHQPEKFYGLFCYWNGKNWRWVKESPAKAFEDRHLLTCAEIVNWRGLANKPRKS